MIISYAKWLAEFWKNAIYPEKLPVFIKETDANLPVVELVKKYGYPIEVYSNIVTVDKYLLDVYRIPHGKVSNNNVVNKPPIFLMHGILTSSSDFVIMGPKRALAFLLADMGFDVWMGNARGSRYSRKHVDLDPDLKDYWKFSWHEIGVYDLPAMLDVVRSVTKQDTFTYIGMSQGTTAFFTLLAEKPEYNEHINLMIALAPVAYLTNIYSPICKIAVPFHATLTALARLGGLLEFPPRPTGKLISYLKQYFTHHSIVRESLLLLIAVACGYNYCEGNKDDIHIIVNNLFDSASVGQLSHFAQVISSGQFIKYDHGKVSNMQLYGTSQPPCYNLLNVKVPVALYHSSADWFCRPKDVYRLQETLPNCIYRYEVAHSEFHHLDFIISNDVVPLVYENVFSILKKYNKLVE